MEDITFNALQILYHKTRAIEAEGYEMSVPESFRESGSLFKITITWLKFAGILCHECK